MNLLRFPAWLRILSIAALATATAGCDRGAPKASPDKTPAPPTPADAPLPLPAAEAAVPESLLVKRFERFTGDKTRAVR